MFLLTLVTVTLTVAVSCTGRVHLVLIFLLLLLLLGPPVRRYRRRCYIVLVFVVRSFVAVLVTSSSTIADFPVILLERVAIVSDPGVVVERRPLAGPNVAIPVVEFETRAVIRVPVPCVVTV